MKGNFRYLAICLVLLAIPTFAGSKTAVKNTRYLVDQALSTNPVDEVSAEIRLQKAFHSAMDLTRPNFSKAVREEGFYLASRCLHPTLASQIRSAIDAYMSLFPKGRFKSEILIQKARLDFLEGKYQDADADLDKAQIGAKSNLHGKIDSLRFNGMILSGKFRSSEKFLQEIQKDRPYKRIKKDIARFGKGESNINEALTKASNNQDNPEIASKILTDAVESGYFAGSAPQAALLALEKADSQPPFYHPVEVTWMGQKRVSRHHLTPQMRLEKLLSILEKFPEADDEIIGKVMLQARSIYLHELNDTKNANLLLEEICSLPPYKNVGLIESLLPKLSERNLGDLESNEILRNLEKLPSSFPYDNGWLPVVDEKLIVELIALSELLAGRKARLAEMLDKFQSSEKFRSIPLQILYNIACDQRSKAYEEYKNISSSISKHDTKLLLDIMFPLYKTTESGELRLIVAMAVSTRFPEKAIDILLPLLSAEDRPFKIDHALFLLADLYQRGRNYAEAQSVWTTLRNLYPRSIWIR